MRANNWLESTTQPIVIISKGLYFLKSICYNTSITTNFKDCRHTIEIHKAYLVDTNQHHQLEPATPVTEKLLLKQEHSNSSWWAGCLELSIISSNN